MLLTDGGRLGIRNLDSSKTLHPSVSSITAYSAFLKFPIRSCICPVASRFPVSGLTDVSASCRIDTSSSRPTNDEQNSSLILTDLTSISSALQNCLRLRRCCWFLYHVEFLTAGSAQIQRSMNPGKRLLFWNFNSVSPVSIKNR